MIAAVGPCQTDCQKHSDGEKENGPQYHNAIEWGANRNKRSSPSGQSQAWHKAASNRDGLIWVIDVSDADPEKCASLDLSD